MEPLGYGPLPHLSLKFRPRREGDQLERNEPASNEEKQSLKPAVRPIGRGNAFYPARATLLCATTRNVYCRFTALEWDMPFRMPLMALNDVTSEFSHFSNGILNWWNIVYRNSESSVSSRSEIFNFLLQSSDVSINEIFLLFSFTIFMK